MLSNMARGWKVLGFGPSSCRAKGATLEFLGLSLILKLFRALGIS